MVFGTVETVLHDFTRLINLHDDPSSSIYTPCKRPCSRIVLLSRLNHGPDESNRLVKNTPMRSDSTNVKIGFELKFLIQNLEKKSDLT